MKFNFLSAILISSTLIFSACGDDDGGGSNPTPSQPTGTLEANRTIFPVTGSNPTTEWSLDNAIAVFESSPFGTETLIITATNAGTGESLVLSGPYNPQTNTISNPSTNPDLGLAVYIRNSTTVPYVSNVNAGETPLFVVQISSRDTVAKTITGIFNTRTINPDSTVQQVLFTAGTFTNLPYVVDDGTPGGTSAMSYTASGSATTASQVTVISSGNTILASGLSSDFTKNLTLQLLSTAGPGTYEITDFGGEFSGSYTVSTLTSPPSSLNYLSTGGTLTISAHDMANDRVQGSFSFNAETQSAPTQTAAVTNGTFDIYY